MLFRLGGVECEGSCNVGKATFGDVGFDAGVAPNVDFAWVPVNIWHCQAEGDNVLTRAAGNF